MDVVVDGGIVVTASDAYEADVGIQNGRIALIGKDLPVERGCQKVDARGQYVFPGGVDAHTHLDSPSQGTHTADDFLTGTIAAACGGTTSIVDFCFPNKGQSLSDGLEMWQARARG